MIREGAAGSIVAMPKGKFPMPRVLPPRRRPRVLIAEGEAETLRQKMRQPAYAAAVREWERLRDLDQNILMNKTAARDGIALAHLEAKAFSYCLFGNREDGQAAVAGILRYFSAVSFEGLADDYRFMGQTMFTAAEIYDWCHDLLTEEEKYTIVATVENQIAPRMEIGMPPCRYGVVAGHQSEAQLLRDSAGEPPVLLLDDVLSELDAGRRDFLLSRVGGMQRIVTACDAGAFTGGRVYRVEAGRFEAE